jgi:hypothetical protein
LNPDTWKYRQTYGVMLSWDGQNEEALEELRAARRLRPESVDTRLAMANTYKWSGDPYRADETFREVLAVDEDNETARDALDDLNRFYVTGLDGYYNTYWDNENFALWETHVQGRFNVSLKLRGRAGYGNVQFEQDEAAGVYVYRERGYYGFGWLEYQFDRLTRVNALVKLYQFEDREPFSVRLELHHSFEDTPELQGLSGFLFFSSQAAVFDVAAARNLQTWTDDLSSDRFGFNANWTDEVDWKVNANGHMTSLSDGNTRYEGYIEGRYVVNDFFEAGANYIVLQADEPSPAYWTPSSFVNYNILGQLANQFDRWNYNVRASVGRVSGSDVTTRNISGALGYKLSSHFNAGVSGMNLTSTREDGRYEFSMFTVTLSYNR